MVVLRIVENDERKQRDYTALILLEIFFYKSMTPVILFVLCNNMCCVNSVRCIVCAVLSIDTWETEGLATGVGVPRSAFDVNDSQPLGEVVSISTSEDRQELKIGACQSTLFLNYASSSTLASG